MVQENLKDALKREAPDGVDVCYDPVGGDFTEPALRCRDFPRIRAQCPYGTRVPCSQDSASF